MRIQTSCKQKSAQRGFNLVEAAIVLGIVGLVIGGIWVAASAINFRQSVSTLTSFVVQVAQSVKGYGPGSEDWGPILNISGLTPPGYTYTSGEFRAQHISYLRFYRNGEILEGSFQPESTQNGVALCTEFLMRLFGQAKQSIVVLDFNDASNNMYLPGNPNFNDLSSLEVVQNECQQVADTGNPMSFQLQ